MGRGGYRRPVAGRAHAETNAVARTTVTLETAGHYDMHARFRDCVVAIRTSS